MEDAESKQTEHLVSLESYKIPALQATEYIVSVEQNVLLKGESLGLLQNQDANPKKFMVDAPRFSIPQGDILSVYPVPGSVAEGNILPYMIFQEASLPWERLVQRDVPRLPLKPDEGVEPWIGLLAFDKHELEATPELLAGVSPSPTTGAFKVTLDKVLGRSDMFCPLSLSSLAISPKEAKETTIEALVVKPDLFTALICDEYDTNTGRLIQPSYAHQKQADISRYKYLAHLRKDFGDSDGVSEQIHAAVMSHRIAPHSKETSTAVFVHLVSLEGWEFSKLPLPSQTQGVVLTSLYAWTYNVPPDPPITFADTMKDLGAAPVYKTGSSLSGTPAAWDTDFRMLRAHPSTISKITKNILLPLPQTQILKSRLDDGYTTVKYRLPTGETTIAFSRGPFTPVPVRDNILLDEASKKTQLQVANQAGEWRANIDDSFVSAQSSFGKDFDILDPQLGLVDITYSSAWQLGQLLALANTDFSDAITKFRRDILNKAVQEAQTYKRTFLSMDSAENEALNIDEAVLERFLSDNSSISRLVDSLRRPGNHNLPLLGAASADLDSQDATAATIETFIPVVDDAPPNNPLISTETPRFPRSFRSERRPGFAVRDDKELDGSTLASNVSCKITENVMALASVCGATVDKWLPAYNEINAPNSADWPTILKQLIDFTNFEGIPLHYFMPHAAYLPLESIRFFYIDPNWMNAMIDGALSIGNTLDIGEHDAIKIAVKAALHRYFMTDFEFPQLSHKPQKPRFGFFIRSQALATWGDLRISAPFPNGWKGRKLEILAVEKIAQDTVMIFLDRRPEDKATASDIPSNTSKEVKEKMLASTISTSEPVYLLQSVIIAQPSRQQCFAFGSKLSETDLTIPIPWDVDPNNTKSGEKWKPLSSQAFKTVFKRGEGGTQIYDWENRVIRVNDYVKIVKNAMGINSKNQEPLKPTDLQNKEQVPISGDATPTKAEQAATPPAKTITTTDQPSRRSFQDVGPVLFAINMGSGMLHMSIEKLRNQEPPFESEEKSNDSKDPKTAAAAMRADAETAKTQFSESTGVRETNTKITLHASKAGIFDPTSEHASGTTVIQSEQDGEKQKSTHSVADFVALRKAHNTPADQYLVPIPRAPHMPVPVKMPVQQPAQVQDDAIKATFSALQLPQGSGIPIVAGPARKADQGASVTPPFVDLLVVISAAVLEAGSKIKAMTIHFCPATSPKTPVVNASVRLTSRYQGSGPQLMNRPRLRTHIVGWSGEGQRISIWPRPTNGEIRKDAIEGLALLLPGVVTDSPRSGNVLVEMALFIMAKDGKHNIVGSQDAFEIQGSL